MKIWRQHHLQLHALLSVQMGLKELSRSNSHLFRRNVTVAAVVGYPNPYPDPYAVGGRRTAQDALVELLEEAGLPPVCVADALEDELGMPLGAVLAAAVQVGDRVACS